MLTRRTLIGHGAAVGLLVMSGEALAAGEGGVDGGGERLPLWPGGPPELTPRGLSEAISERAPAGAAPDRAIKGVVAPWLDLFRPSQPNGATIIAVPGGGYEHLAWDKEGLEIARRFAGLGVTALALGYRLPRDGWAGGLDTPLADAQRAVRMVRAMAPGLGVDPARIAVVGFSAGGHLVTKLGAAFGREVYPARDAADRLSARPDLVAAAYPAIMMDRLAGMAPAGQALFGKAMSPAELALQSPYRNVSDNTPPHFLLHAEDDPLVSPEHTLAMRAALVAKKRTVETHLLPTGGHGFGLRLKAGTPGADWPDQLLAFGRLTGWMR